MFTVHDQRFRDILILVLGFFGALCFFFNLGNHHPLSAVEIPLDNEEAISKADSIFRSWQYQPVNLKKRAKISTYARMVNHLQQKYGRSVYLENAKNETTLKLPFYNWRVSEFSIVDGEPSDAFFVELSKDGEMVTFSASDEVINEQTPFNRDILHHAIQKGEFTKVQEDSIITALVDFQHLRGNAFSFFKLAMGSERNYDDSFIWSGIEYYLKNSYWKRFDFNRDSLAFDENSSFRFAKAFLTSKDTVMGVVPKLEVDIMPGGVLRKLEANFGDYDSENENTSQIRANTILGFLLLFSIWLLITFYLRIKARVIDTRPALIIAIVSGFMVSLLILLQYSKNLGITLQTSELSVLFGQILVFGVAGAFTAAAFFMVTAVSDSVTRQYWPEKLNTWDLVRRGMFKNKPVGWAIVRSISIGAILAGVYALFLGLFPRIYVSGAPSFLSSEFALAPLAGMISSLIIVLGFIVIAFLILGNQLYAISSKKWVIPIFSGVLVAAIDPAFLNLEPASLEMYFNFGLGLLLGTFYVLFDFVTIGLGYFIFLNTVSTSNGWLVSNSPDASVFYWFLVTMFFFMAAALYFLLKGEDKDSLPEYIPEYIEDLAKEERVKQELDISKTVQKTFLPVNTPEIPGFDSAAVCFPAQETGGDYYDIICLDDTRAAVAIGDVSGKGIQAAFYMTFAKGVIHSLCTIFPSPKMMLYRVNKLFNQHATRGTFISMIYGVLDSKEKSFTFIRAGHNPILLKKNSGDVKWLQPKGVAIGMAKGEAFNKVVQEEKIPVNKGDVLVLYTDGITEAMNEQGAFYDEERLFKLVKREKTRSAKELRDLIIEDVRIFIGDALQYDDMTLVVIKA